MVAAPFLHFHLSWSFVSGVASLILSVDPAAAARRQPVAGVAPQSGIGVHDVEPGSDVVPGAHAVQAAEPAMFANVPDGHGLHSFAPGAGANEPAAHGEHGCVPVGENVPISHATASGMHDVEPGSAVVPSGQAVQTNAPMVLENVSAGHGRQELEPGIGAKVPATQGEHGSVPLGLDVPAGHAGSVVVVTVVHDAEPGSDVVPGGQARHAAAPGAAANVSAGHAEQVIEPRPAAKDPGSHGEQGSLPVGEKLPAEHGAAVHDVDPGGAVVPTGHASHANAPATLENVSLGQRRQALMPGVDANVPGVQGEHGAVPPGPDVPAGHVASVVVVTGVHDVDPGSEVVPIGHAWHDSDPLVAAKVSAGQGLQLVCPDAAWKKPGAHCVHGAAPVGLELPGEQSCAAAGKAVIVRGRLRKRVPA